MAFLLAFTVLLSSTACTQVDDIKFQILEIFNQHQELKDKLSKKADKSEFRSDYPSDEAYTNFRACNVGKLKKNYIFRGPAPYREDDRSKYICDYLRINDVHYVVTLCDPQEKIDSMLNDEAYADNYFIQSVKDGTIIDDVAYYPSLINFDDPSDVKILVQSLKNLSNSEGNVYVHCHSGRDRTGGYCVLLGCLADASYNEIVDDYMLSFKLLSYVTQQDYPDTYNLAIEKGVDKFLHDISKDNKNVDLSELDLKQSAVDFLIEHGMTSSEVEKLINKICEN